MTLLNSPAAWIPAFGTALCVILSGTISQAELTERQLKSEHRKYKSLVSVELLDKQAEEMEQYSTNELADRNEITLQALEKYTPQTSVFSRPRLKGVSRDFAANLIQTIDSHPVAGGAAMSRYSQRGTEIGYCFGRATYVHFALLHHKVHKDSIKKVWAVGPMTTGSIPWGFHVGTAVYSKNNEWIMVDNFVGRVVTVREWFAEIKQMDQDKTLRIYVTDPEKFSVGLDYYNREEMGLDVSRSEDWYKHYFKDLTKWFKNPDFASVGLTKRP
jgi:hypothetical protein